MRRYNQIIEIIKEVQPKVILEVGTHKATRPREWIKVCNFQYIGFDLFEDCDKDIAKKEMNGKEPSTMEEAKKNLKGIDSKLFKGFSRDTIPKFLLEYDRIVDLAFIDGGHSLDTIQDDWENVSLCMKPGGIVIFDDYYTGVYPKEFGCNEVVFALKHKILPIKDVFTVKGGAIGIQLVRVDIC